MILYPHIIYWQLANPLLAGAFAVVVPEAYKKTNLESNRNFKDLWAQYIVFAKIHWLFTNINCDWETKDSIM